MIGILRFRYRRFFVPHQKEKENFATKQFMPRAGKYFEKSTALSQMAIQFIDSVTLRWIWCVLIL